jgi:uncharacterized protein YdeI (YjbR/CyaY-like superfamily)
MKNTKTVDEYLKRNEKWSATLDALRNALLATEMSETIKWGVPTYTVEGKNVAAMVAFKNHAALWFFQGALLGDPQKILLNAQEGKTAALRQIRFKLGDEVDAALIGAYINEAIENQKAGKEIKPSLNKPLIIPDELQQGLDKDAGLSSCFESLSLSQRREYAEYVSTAKRVATRQSRILKIIPMIKSKIGLNDKYR